MRKTVKKTMTIIMLIKIIRYNKRILIEVIEEYKEETINKSK